MNAAPPAAKAMERALSAAFASALSPSSLAGSIEPTRFTASSLSASPSMLSGMPVLLRASARLRVKATSSG